MDVVKVLADCPVIPQKKAQLFLRQLVRGRSECVGVPNGRVDVGLISPRGVVSGPRASDASDRDVVVAATAFHMLLSPMAASLVQLYQSLERDTVTTVAPRFARRTERQTRCPLTSGDDGLLAGKRDARGIMRVSNSLRTYSCADSMVSPALRAHAPEEGSSKNI